MENKYGRLLFLRELDTLYTQPSGKKEVLWEFLCDCGKVCCKIKRYVIYGRAKSCGCLHKEMVKRVKTTHTTAKKSTLHVLGCNEESLL